MRMDAESRGRIYRFYYNDKLSVNQISIQTGFHHKTVQECLKKDLSEKKSSWKRGFPPVLNKNKEEIQEILKQFPKISAVRLQEILTEKGVKCSFSSVRRAMVSLRGKKTGAVFGTRVFVPGQEAQVDWGEIRVPIGQTRTKLYIFVMVLSYSRNLFAYVTKNMKFETFSGCHSLAFQHFCGVPRSILYDNLKSVVIERVGDIIRFKKEFYDYSTHYLFEPIACHVRCPQEKGIFERNVSYIKHNFFNAREFSSLDEVNDQLSLWLLNRMEHSHPTDRKQTIEDYFKREDLISLPGKVFFPRRYETVKVGKQPFVHFETNRYSIPCEYAFSGLSLHVGMKDIEIYHGNELIALHERSFERDKVIEDKEHTASLMRHRKKSTAQTYQRGSFIKLIPETEKIFKDLAKTDSPLKPTLKRIEQMIERYGISLVEQAFKKAQQEGMLYLDAVEMTLSSEKEDGKEWIQSQLPHHLKKLKTKHHDLKTYGTRAPV